VPIYFQNTEMEYCLFPADFLRDPRILKLCVIVVSYFLTKSSYELTKHRIEVSIRARSGGCRGRDSSSHRSSVLTDVALILGGVVAVLQQLAALPGDVLIGVRCCYRAVVSSLRILLLLLVVAVVVSTAVRAVATAEPDDDDE
jgi:hypothetical protein